MSEGVHSVKPHTCSTALSCWVSSLCTKHCSRLLFTCCWAFHSCCCRHRRGCCCCFSNVPAPEKEPLEAWNSFCSVHAYSISSIVCVCCMFPPMSDLCFILSYLSSRQRQRVQLKMTPLRCGNWIIHSAHLRKPLKSHEVIPFFPQKLVACIPIPRSWIDSLKSQQTLHLLLCSGFVAARPKLLPKSPGALSSSGMTLDLIV